MPVTKIFGKHDDNTLRQLNDVASRAEYTALMADGHMGYVMPIGGVAAYRDQISVVGVGFDIACGNAAIRTDLTLTVLAERYHQDFAAGMNRLADEIRDTISFGIGRRNEADDAPTDDALFEDPRWELFPREVNVHNFKGKARSQLGTVGGGNHYVDVFDDETGAIWVGVHFGSRGFGYGIASGFLALAQGQPWEKRVPEQETLLNIKTSLLGNAYWELMQLAGRYAYVGREWVARKVVSILGGKELELVHNHHNFAWKERHFGEDLITVRKGATPAFPGQKGFVGGSMGDDSVILEGTYTGASPLGFPYTIPEQHNALFSTVHGAGRVMSRTAAKGKGWRRRGGPKEPGAITRQMMSEWTKGKGVIVRGGDVDEAPQVYRRLPEVLADQGPTITVLHTLRPLIVVMADPQVRDPYKD